MTVEQKVAKERERLNKLGIKKAELENDLKKINKDIQKIQDNIYSLENEVKAENMREIEKALGGSGLNIQDVIKAIQNGDVLDLQEKIENANAKKEIETSDSESDNVGNETNALNK